MIGLVSGRPHLRASGPRRGARLARTRACPASHASSGSSGSSGSRSGPPRRTRTPTAGRPPATPRRRPAGWSTVAHVRAHQSSGQPSLSRIASTVARRSASTATRRAARFASRSLAGPRWCVRTDAARRCDSARAPRCPRLRREARSPSASTSAMTAGRTTTSTRRSRSRPSFFATGTASSSTPISRSTRGSTSSPSATPTRARISRP